MYSTHLYAFTQLLYELLVNILHPLRVLLVQGTKHAGESVQTGSKARKDNDHHIDYRPIVRVLV